MNAFLDFPLRFLLDKNTLFFFFLRKRENLEHTSKRGVE